MRTQRLLAALLAAAVLALGLAAAHANSGDVQEVSNYVLSESALAKFTQATGNLRTIPGVCAHEDEDDDSGAASIDAMVAKLDAAPGAQAAIQSAGMTTREYIVFMMSMMQSGMAAWALTQPGGKLPPGISQANVNFYNQHAAAMEALGKDDPCASADGETETQEQPEQ